MRILAILWTACLVRLCSAGCLCCFRGSKTDDDEVTVRTVQGGSNEVSTENISTPPQPTEPKEVSTETSQSAGQGDDTLDLAHPDMTKVNLVTDCKNGIKTKRFTPTGASKVTSVVDGNKELWKKDEDYQKFLSATLSSKGDSSVLLISLRNADDKYFEKTAYGWRSVEKNDYDKKLKNPENGVISFLWKSFTRGLIILFSSQAVQ